MSSEYDAFRQHESPEVTNSWRSRLFAQGPFDLDNMTVLEDLSKLNEEGRETFEINTIGPFFRIVVPTTCSEATAKGIKDPNNPLSKTSATIIVMEKVAEQIPIMLEELRKQLKSEMEGSKDSPPWKRVGDNNTSLRINKKDE